MSDTNTDQSELRASLAQSAKRRKSTIAAISGGLAAALVAGVVSIIVVRGNSGDDAEAAGDRLSLTLATDEDSTTNDTIAEVAGENGLDVEWVNLDDWVLPNTEVVGGSMDGNAFQHVMYLSTFDVENNADLVPVFSTFVSNWGVFSATVDSLDDLPDGARIAIPDDASNGGRALIILQAAGLIELDESAGSLATTSDITENPKDLEFTEISAQSIPQQFDDPSLDAVVVGVHHFDPSQEITVDDALYIFDPESDANLPYINVVATRADNVDDPAWQVLEEAYDDPRVLDALAEEYSGTQTRVDIDRDVLHGELDRLVAEAGGED
ncbi:MAG TPA: hypothetical protein H9793_06495 [Candidatus Brevibacterium intestinigallinarum]|uniref:MetQ/NlpA family ABC transporter substrate-binding protein n=1 Tax=Brevibacterium senegalense TaxID=1033736 RepID=UPI0002FE96ED|nr:MetQ/NlpA family ABC transporter substrate-binding protein [Brevibacterium senegalense]HJA38620.1 hypothetical protein [Candidatus Brevibacterium intestinigallinarum]